MLKPSKYETGRRKRVATRMMLMLVIMLKIGEVHAWNKQMYSKGFDECKLNFSSSNSSINNINLKVLWLCLTINAVNDN
jgi:hypothetical protein